MLLWYLPKAVYKNASYNERYTRYVRLHTRCPGIRQAQGDGCPGVYHAELRGGCPPSLPPWWNRRPPPSGACVSALWPGGSLSTTAAGPSRGCQQPTPPPTRGTMHNLQVYTTQNMEVQKKRAAHSLVLQAGHKTPQYGTTLLPQRSFACHSPACEPLIFFNWSFSPIIAENQRRDKDDSPSHFPSPLSFLLFNSLSNHWNLLKSRLLSNDSYYEQSLKEWINSGVLKKNLYWVIKTIFHGPERQIEILKQKSKGVFTLIL